MKLIIALGSSILISSLALATGKGHGTHEHGVGKLNIAIEGKKLKIELELPGDTAYGFEHKAKSDKDKKAISKTVQELSKIDELINFDLKFECEVKVVKIDPAVAEGDEDGHFELHASYEGLCKSEPKGGTLKIKFDGISRLHELRTQLISDSLQTSAILEHGVGQLKF